MAPIPIFRRLKKMRANRHIHPPMQNPRVEPALRAAWWCCRCKTQNFLQIRPGNHPLGRCVCKCRHTPCEECNFTGQVKHFVPIQDPIPVTHPGVEGEDKSEKQKEIPYGIICAECGQSWRAEEVKEPKKDSLRRKKDQAQGYLQGDNKANDSPADGLARVMAHDKAPSALAQRRDDMLPPRRERNNLSQDRELKAQSMINLLSDYQRVPNRNRWGQLPHSRRSVTDPSTNSGTPNGTLQEVELVKSMTVRFGGVKCTCGCAFRVSGSSHMQLPGCQRHSHSRSEHDLFSALRLTPRSSFTFKLDLPDSITGTAATNDKGIRKFSSPLRPLSAYEYDVPRALAHPEWLKAKGHGERILKLGPCGDIQHANPLRSNEVNPMDYLDSRVEADRWKEPKAESIGHAHEGSPFMCEACDEGSCGDEEHVEADPTEEVEELQDWEL